MGEERTLDDLKKYSKEEGWKFSNWNARLWLLKYVFFNIIHFNVPLTRFFLHQDLPLKVLAV